MSETIQELEDTIKATQQRIEEIEAFEREQALELEQSELTKQIEEKIRSGEYTGERIAASVKEMVESMTKEPSFTTDRKTLYHVLTQIGTLTGNSRYGNNETTFQIDKEGIRLRFMDPSHVGLIDMVLPAEMFYEFEKNIEPRKFGVIMDELVKIVKNFDKNDKIEVTIGPSMLHLKSDSYKTSLRLIETEYREPPLPRQTFNADLELSINTLKKFKGVQAVSEYINILAGKDCSTFNISGKGDSGTAEMDLTSESHTITKESSATYSMDYLMRVINNITRDIKDTVHLEFSTRAQDYSTGVLRLSYRLNEYGKIEFYLAPRVQD